MRKETTNSRTLLPTRPIKSYFLKSIKRNYMGQIDREDQSEYDRKEAGRQLASSFAASIDLLFILTPPVPCQAKD
jgi:hypothetical protein